MFSVCFCVSNLYQTETKISVSKQTEKIPQRPYTADAAQAYTLKCSTKSHIHMQHRLYYKDTDTSRCSTKDEDRDTEVQHRLLYRKKRPGEAQVAAVKCNADSAKIRNFKTISRNFKEFLNNMGAKTE
jgi:hypothetical protein